MVHALSEGTLHACVSGVERTVTVRSCVWAMIVIHACTMNSLQAYITSRENACIECIIYTCTMALVHGCTKAIPWQYAHRLYDDCTCMYFAIRHGCIRIAIQTASVY